MKKKRFRQIIIILGALFIFNFTKTGYTQINKIIALKEEQKQIDREIVTTKKKIKSLESKDYSTDDLLFVEQIARDKLGMVKADEILVRDKEVYENNKAKFSESPKLTVKENKN